MARPLPSGGSPSSTVRRVMDYLQYYVNELAVLLFLALSFAGFAYCAPQLLASHIPPHAPDKGYVLAGAVARKYS
ncbi:MAG: hypothetical protein JWN13_6402 [Betaproteobacteria bacterium]|jgi:hypothetical protein|nr:hypothetical protein [Betaproteobacteria bacterium]